MEYLNRTDVENLIINKVRTCTTEELVEIFWASLPIRNARYDKNVDGFYFELIPIKEIHTYVI